MKKKEVLNRLMIARRLTKLKLADAMCITRPTLQRLLNNPELINGTQRTLMAKALTLPTSVVDILLNEQNKVDEKQLEVVIESIKPLNNKTK